MSTCEICKQKPACASIARGSDGNLYLHVEAHSAVGNMIPLCYEVVPSPQTEISMPHQEGALCDACIRGYGAVGMLVLVGDDDESIEKLRQRLANEGPLKPGEVDAALREARELRAKYETPAESYECIMRELLRRRAKGPLDQDTEERYAVMLSDYRAQMTNEEQAEIEKKIAVVRAKLERP